MGREAIGERGGGDATYITEDVIGGPRCIHDMSVRVALCRKEISFADALLKGEILFIEPVNGVLPILAS